MGRGPLDSLPMARVVLIPFLPLWSTGLTLPALYSVAEKPLLIAQQLCPWLGGVCWGFVSPLCQG